MSATMARQGGRVQREQSNMRLASNIAHMAKDNISHTAIEETKYLMKKPHTEVGKGTKWSADFPGNKTLRAAIQRHLAMLRQNQTSGCLPSKHGTAKNPQTSWRRKGTGAPPPARHIVRTPEPNPPPPDTVSANTGNPSGAPLSEIVNLLAGYTSSHRALTSVE
jgi:hypothetical protein